MSADTATGGTASAGRFNPDRDVEEWHGKYLPYDLVKEFIIAFVVVAIVVVGLAVIFSSPDDKPVTVKSWSTGSPVDFAQTAITELDGTSGTATYGPPYNGTTGATQSIGASHRRSGSACTIPSTRPTTTSSTPCGPCPTARRPGGRDPVHLGVASQQAAWTAAYEKAVAKADAGNGSLVVPPGAYGPVGTIIGSLTSMARSGALDGALLSSRQFYGTDYTKPLLFIADGTYLANMAQSQHLSGDQWGMMNETGSFPGQAWLWLYTLWYQVPADQHLGQRRLPGVGHHDAVDPGAGAGALHPRAPLDPPVEPGVPADLAPALPGAGRAGH